MNPTSKCTGRRRLSYRPFLESLECRRVPSGLGVLGLDVSPGSLHSDAVGDVAHTAAASPLHDTPPEITLPLTAHAHFAEGIGVGVSAKTDLDGRGRVQLDASADASDHLPAGSLNFGGAVSASSQPAEARATLRADLQATTDTASVGASLGAGDVAVI